MSALRVRNDFIERIGAMSNPTWTHPEDFFYLQQPSPRQSSRKRDLSETSQAKELEVHLIGDFEDEEFETKSETDMDDELPPLITRKI